MAKLYFGKVGQNYTLGKYGKTILWESMAKLYFGKVWQNYTLGKYGKTILLGKVWQNYTFRESRAKSF
jgi:hypothetical protein